MIYGDVCVSDAHPALVDRETWRRVRDIAETRSDAHNQRAMSESDYHLTGLITCPECGNKYIGTSARGRSRIYNYYTCYSRTRYGTHGCTAPRFGAQAIDAAALQALHDFYQKADTLIGDAILRARAHHRDSYADRHAELDAIEAQISTKHAAVDRYHAAFENGTMDEETAGDRLKALRREIETLKARRDHIADAIEDQPTAPEPSTLARIRDHLTKVITDGTSAERKATIEDLIAEIRIDKDERIIPVFKIPGPDYAPPGDNPATATTEAAEPQAVRAMLRSVGRAGLEPATEGL